MTQSEHTSRTRRAQPLVDLVEKVQGGYRVKSARNAEISYFVSKPNGRIHCTCSDFEKHFQEDVSWQCKHIEAAILAHKQGKINGGGRTQAPEAATTESPSPDGAEISEEEASQDLEATVPEFPEGEATSLDSCGKCGRTFTADELFPTNGPDGSSLLCWECLKASTATEEPPLTYPCICCGADGLAYREVVPHTMNLGGDEGTICLLCLEDIRKGRVVERMGKDGICVFVHPNGTEKRAYSTQAVGGPQPSVHSPRSPAGGANTETIPAQAPCCRCGRFFPLAQLDGEGFCSECLETVAGSGFQRVPGSGFGVRGSKNQKLGTGNQEPVLTLVEKIIQANELLASWGAVAVDTDQKGFTGYGFQYVIDAVNSALGPAGWRYELLTHQVEKSSEKAHKAVVLLQLHLRLDDGSWFTKGPQFGGSQNTDSTDALKGALSDGLKKAFSHWGVGNLAYRGELGGGS